MKKLFIGILTLIISHSAFSTRENVSCTLSRDGGHAWTINTSIEDEKVFLGNQDEYSFYLKKQSNQYELEIYNRNMPSRQYAQGDMSNGIGWAIWTRDILLEISCHPR
jgi:hypothetical protein